MAALFAHEDTGRGQEEEEEEEVGGGEGGKEAPQGSTVSNSVPSRRPRLRHRSLSLPEDPGRASDVQSSLEPSTPSSAPFTSPGVTFTQKTGCRFHVLSSSLPHSLTPPQPPHPHTPTNQRRVKPTTAQVSSSSNSTIPPVSMATSSGIPPMLCPWCCQVERWAVLLHGS